MITVNTKINAPLQKVWDCWTKPKHITNWNFASNDWRCPKALNDFKKGGQFMWRMEAKDGSTGFDFTGLYDEIKEGELINYHISDGRKVTITFSKVGDNVHLIESFEAENIHTEQQQKAGWQSILDNFKKYVESL